jgi:hypothetical protein
VPSFGWVEIKVIVYFYNLYIVGTLWSSRSRYGILLYQWENENKLAHKRCYSKDCQFSWKVTDNLVCNISFLELIKFNCSIVSLWKTKTRLSHQNSMAWLSKKIFASNTIHEGLTIQVWVSLRYSKHMGRKIRTNVKNSTCITILDPTIALNPCY